MPCIAFTNSNTHAAPPRQAGVRQAGCALGERPGRPFSEHRAATLQRPPARRGLQCPVWRFHKQAAERGSCVPDQDRDAGRSFLFIRQPIANERPRTGAVKFGEVVKPSGLSTEAAGGDGPHPYSARVSHAPGLKAAPRSGRHQ